VSALKGKVVIITGATRGIGRAISDAFIRKGANLAICSRNEIELKKVAEELSEVGKDSTVFYSKCDVGSYEEIKQFISKVSETFGRVDILVNNAGIGVFNKIDEIDIKDWQTVVNTNLNGCFYLCHEVLPQLKKNTSSPKGFIINLGSISHNTLVEGNSVYSSSKAALKTFSDHLYNELREQNILVSYLAVGSVDTFFSKRNPDLSGWKIKPVEVAEVVLQLVISGLKNKNYCITYSEIKVKYPVKREVNKE
jgi:3-oxoacyl-[acyl-carrier protein] reductase